MQFDFLISNPAFNIAESNNKAGTGGNTTLYKTATRHAFDYLKSNGILLNVTLKGIINDLLYKNFSFYQTHFINLMDDIEVWPYNTCYFAIEKKQKESPPKIMGGLAAKIYSVDSENCFPFVYYSCSNNSMKGFSKNGKHKVIRKLPGKNNDEPEFDYTNEEVDYGWKFAFNVMESKKSYTVTNHPIRGGTICYIPTDTKDQAEKLKLFVEKNEAFKEYIRRSKIKYHAFGMRHVKKFDLNQIVSGYEIPKEWNIIEDDLHEPKKLLNENVNDSQKLKNQGQVYTPAALVNKMLDDLEKIRPDAFTNKDYTFCDTMCGNGRFLKAIVDRKIKNGISQKDAVKSIHGVEIDKDSVAECKKVIAGDNVELQKIVDNNVICSDTFEYDFNFTNPIEKIIEFYDE
mgnify:CR=1 FL=1